MEVTPVLPNAGQELWYFMEYLEFFGSISRFLFIYSMISHRTPSRCSAQLYLGNTVSDHQWMWHTSSTVIDKQNWSAQRETCPGTTVSTTGWLDIAQAVSCWPIIIKTWVQTQAIPCGICGSQIRNRTCFSKYFSCQYLSNNLPHSHFIHLTQTLHNLSKREHHEQNTSLPTYHPPHKSHLTCLGIEPRPPQWDTSK